MGNGNILAGTMIAGLAVMMMLSSIPAMAQPIDVDSVTPQTDSHADGKCFGLGIAIAVNGGPGNSPPSLVAEWREACHR